MTEQPWWIREHERELAKVESCLNCGYPKVEKRSMGWIEPGNELGIETECPRCGSRGMRC
jgi:hypothetical protein